VVEGLGEYEMVVPLPAGKEESLELLPRAPPSKYMVRVGAVASGTAAVLGTETEAEAAALATAGAAAGVTAGAAAGMALRWNAKASTLVGNDLNKAPLNPRTWASHSAHVR